MTKRALTIGGYHTAADGLWTLASWALSEAVYKQTLIEIPGSSTMLDLSTSNTDGEPAYNSRTFTAILESSEGDRLARKIRIDSMINTLDGYIHQITLPDDPERYIEGRVSVKELYNDLAHASVEVTAFVQPWKSAKQETQVKLVATTTEQEATLHNKGKRPVVPTIEITGGDVSIRYDNKNWVLSPGTYALPDLYLKPGALTLKYSGAGTVWLKYREAVL
jgi:hypothetical protein